MHEILEKLKLMLQKLDLMSVTDYTIEGICKIIKSFVKETHNVVLELKDKLDEVLVLLKKEPDHSDFYFSKFIKEETIVEGRLEKINMNEFQQVVGHYQATKKNGQPAEVQNPTVETDHPELVEVSLDEAAKTVTVAAIEGAVTEPTAVLVTVKADADLGEGVKEISVVGTIPLTPGEAETLAITFDEPTDKA